jgi:hypothetical protein
MAAAFPEVIALAKRAFPQLCAVWFGLDPEEKYAPSPLLTIFFSAITEHPVAFASSGFAVILST